MSETRGGWLVVFAKAPRAGRVKTRFVPALSPDEAAALYAALLADVLAVSARAASELGLRPLLALDPPEAAAELVRTAPPPFAALPQRGEDLGRRMERVVTQAGAANAWPVLLRGSDSPLLAEAELAAARAALTRRDLVLAPDRDGGYSLAGLRRPAPGLFAHAMSTSRTCDDTEANAVRVGLSVERLPVGFDLDTAEDLADLARARASGRPLPCPRTLELLDRLALWSRASSLARSPGRG